ncbi:hypothetical protein [Schaalia radingae]|uniref:Uncharacterized protein n=1 Tax=Schaalia radingae TaxID=131110 RepID=A0ABY0VCK8_9ACTO|nr:hypothetical protein [Schaalia radingae]SDU08264.1 hypothetical protein SAMN04489714_2053 [Schaalia radingae]
MAVSMIHVTTPDGEHTYPLRPAAIVKAEEYLAARGKSLTDAQYTGTAFAAYTEARRAGDTQAAFTEWLDGVDELTTDSEDEAAPFRE